MSLLLEPGFVPPDIPTVEKIVSLNPTWFDEAISETEAALLLDTTAAALSQMRVRNEGAPFHRIGRRIFYTRRGIIDYIRLATVMPVSPQRKHVRRDLRRR